MKKGFLISSFSIFAISVVMAAAAFTNYHNSESQEITLSLSALNSAYLNTQKLLVTPRVVKVEEAVLLKSITAKKVAKAPVSKSIHVIKKKEVVEARVVAVEKITPVKFEKIEKDINIEPEALAINEYPVENEYSKNQIAKADGEITVEEKIKLVPIKIEEIKTTSLVALFNPIHDEVVSVKEVLMAEVNRPIENKEDKNSEDRISTALAATEKSIKEVDVNIAKSTPELATKKVSEVQVVPSSDYSSSNDQINDPVEMNLPRVEVGPERKSATVITPAVVKAEEVAFEVPAQKVEKKNDEIVFFDYSKNEAPAAKAPMQEEIQKWAEKEIKHKKPLNSKTTKNVDTKKIDDTVSAFASESAFASGYSLPKKARRNTAKNFDYSFELARIDGPGKLSKQLTYEFDFKDDFNDRFTSDSQGQLNLIGKTFHKNIRKFSIHALDVYTTTVDQQINAGSQKIVVPVFSKEYFNNLIAKESLQALGGHIFVELDSLTEDVELDVNIPYEKKIYLNGQFQPVQKTESDYDYIMFVGIRPGNTIIKFKTYNNEITTKIVHVADSEIFYEPNYYEEVKKDNFRLFEEHILSKNILPLDLDTQKIAQFSQNEKVQKSALGEYYFTKSLYPSSTRKYLELSHLKDSVFVGYSMNKNIVVPSENYIQVVLDKLGVNSLNNQCIVQLNLEEKARSISIEGQSFRGAMRLSPVMLDEDGVFYDEFTVGTKRVFIHGEEQGIVNIKLNYNDGSVAYIQTYCSNNTYLIEQL